MMAIPRNDRSGASRANLKFRNNLNIKSDPSYDIDTYYSKIHQTTVWLDGFLRKRVATLDSTAIQMAKKFKFEDRRLSLSRFSRNSRN